MSDSVLNAWGEAGVFTDDVQRIEAEFATGKIGGVLYSSPNNPTWVCFKEPELEGIGQLCSKYNVIAIEDIFKARTGVETSERLIKEVTFATPKTLHIFVGGEHTDASPLRLRVHFVDRDGTSR